MPFLSNFLQTNVRSYVKWHGKQGVFLFSADASNRIATWIAREYFCLPCVHAQMSKRHLRDGIHYSSQRMGSGGMNPRFEAVVRPSGEPYFAKRDGLEAWLLERYCFFTLNHARKLCVGEIHHKPWHLQQAEVEIKANALVEAIGLRVPSSKPNSHFVSNLKTLVWPLSNCE